jgi:hypothetical protein
MLRAEPAVFGPVASDPIISRLVDALAASGPRAPETIRGTRCEVRTRVWELDGASSPAADGQVIVDIDGVLMLAHSEHQDAATTWKTAFGHHPLVAFVDHGQAGCGEPVAALLRPGNAGSNTAGDHIEPPNSPLLAAQTPTAGTASAAPRRLRWRHPRLPRLALPVRAMVVVFRRNAREAAVVGPPPAARAMLVCR